LQIKEVGMKKIISFCILLVSLVALSQDNTNSIAEEFVIAHNAFRTKLKLPSVSWDQDIADYAQEWADYLQANDCKMQHRSKAGRKERSYGENLSWASGKHMEPLYVVTQWVKEAKDYDYETNKCTPGKKCGHFTQVIWKTTARIGCGVAYCDNSEVWVCNYDPPGNYVGKKPY
jgi:pathogenesis-related protein 1